MECRSCGRALDATANFCPGCGLAVEARCLRCGATIEADARFCKHCGASVGGPAGGDDGDTQAPTRERKVATMLFADIAGSTGLAERHDPEIVSRLVSELFDRLSTEVDRYGGTVEKFAGDAMLAVFGVPSTHEDDPERAVRAALEMLAAVQPTVRADGTPPIQLRIGIESGEVLADLGRSAEERDLFVTGDPVNTASRLQALAAPGTVIVGPTTYASTRELIEYEELVPRSLKGKELPVASWRAVRVKRRRGGVRAPLGLEASLIGRDEELGLLKETIRKTSAAGRPHLVTLVGDAGVGKTRLVWELEKYLDGLPETFHWRKGRCYSYASLSYSPLVEAVKADAGISEDDAPGVGESRLASRLADLGLDDPDVIAAVRALIGLSDEGQLARDELFEGWRRYLAAIAERHPLVLVVEDIHWADEVTLDFIEFVARWGDAPITLLCVARPELLVRREAWSGGVRNAVIAELNPLDDGEATRMIDELLDGALPAEVTERMVRMAGGNPLFTEELVRMFVDRGVLRLSEGRWRLVGRIDELAVPGSVQSVLSARLDELPPDEKRVAQEASVVGRIFWDAIVAHLRERPADEVDQLLRGLRVKELVEPRSPSTMAGAAEWAFHHVLVRDVAYESLPKADRGALHLEVARWAEGQLADRIHEFAELVASHVEAALRYAEELDGTGADGPPIEELRSTALDAARRAAQRASVVQDIAGASRWQVFAIDQARKLDRPALERARLADEFHGMVWHEVDAAERARVYGEAVELLEPVEGLSGADLELWSRLTAHRAQAVHESGSPEPAERMLAEADEILAPTSPSRARARVLQTLGWVRWRVYDFDGAEPAIEGAMAEAKASGADDVYRWALHEAGLVKGFRGDVEGALRLTRESYELALAADDHALLSRCYINIPSISLNSGHSLVEPVRLLDIGLTRARRASAYGTIAFLGDNRSAVHHFMGEFEAALEVCDEAQDAAERAGFQPIIAMIHRTRADALRALGRIDASEAQLALAEAQVSEDDRQHYQWLLIAQSVRDFRHGHVAGAIERLARPHEELKGYPNAELQMALWLGRLAYRAGDRAALEQAIAVQQRHATVGGPAMRLEARWLAALAAEDAHALEALAPGFRELQLNLYAVDVLVDAALLAARHGDGVAAVERAQAAADAYGYHPMLGPLPETRWLTAGQGEPVTNA